VPGSAAAEDHSDIASHNESVTARRWRASIVARFSRTGLRVASCCSFLPPRNHGVGDGALVVIPELIRDALALERAAVAEIIDPGWAGADIGSCPSRLTDKLACAARPERCRFRGRVLPPREI
jgi:hypothetical protein